MGEPGFWDDPEAAAQGQRRARARAAQARDASASSPSDAEDLDGLAELAEEDPELAAELEEHARLGARRGSAALEEQRLFTGRYDAGDALVTVNAGAGGTDAQDWAEMVLRMVMRWAERRGFKVELLEASPGEEAGIKSATFRADGENAYGLYSAEKGVHRLVRLSPFDSANRRQTSFAGVEVAPGGRGGRRRRDRRRRPADRHLPRLGRRRPARQQDRLRGPDHAPADRHRRAVPERALAVVQPRDRDGDAALQARRARGAQSAARRSRASAARRRTSTSARRSAPTSCTRTRWSRTTARTSRWATPTGVLDGDLDGFVRAYLEANARASSN